MEDQKIISILKQARSLTPNKKWEGVAREAMLVYTQNPPKERSGIFGMLTRYRSAPYLVMGSVITLVLITGSISLPSSNTIQIGDNEPTILSQEQQTTQPPKTKNETSQEVLGFLLYEEPNNPMLIPQTVIPHTDIQNQNSYTTIRESTENAFEEYLSALEALEAIDPENQESIEEAMSNVQETADTFIASLQFGNINQEESFEYALRIAIAYRQQQCSDPETQEQIAELLDENTTTALGEANILSLQCEKDLIPLNT